MKLLNRISVGVQPRQPYVDWVNSLPTELTEIAEPLTLQQHQQESRVYLLDESDQEGAALVLNSKLWERIFTNELSAWDEFADHWPELTLERFQNWFVLLEMPVVFDVAEEPLLRAELT